MLFENTAHIILADARLGGKRIQLIAGTVVVGDITQDFPGMVDSGIIEGDGIVIPKILAEDQAGDLGIRI